MRFSVARTLIAALAIAASACVDIKPAVAGPENVPFDLAYDPGSIVIINKERRLYYVLEGRRALRYRVAVGNEEEIWTGMEVVTAKRENPTWTDPDDEENVVEGGPDNPLGVRAMYLGWTLWRIHGTPKRWSIGRAVSNGCIRMLNEDVTDLYDRVHIGAPVYVLRSREQAERPQHRGIKLVELE